MPENKKSNKPKRQCHEDLQELKQNAIKFKAFQHTFSNKEVEGGLDKKRVKRRLKESKQLEESYLTYLQELKKDPTKKVPFPWDSPFRRFLFFMQFWGPKAMRWSLLALAAIVVINFIPGPTQHIVEFFMARAIYDAAPIPRLPTTLDTYAHSATIVDASANTIKTYGRREVTREIPEKVKLSLLACEDHYLLPHPENPWFVNGFLVHAGVSWFNLLGAVKDTIQGHPRGASTIIMQNAKKVLGNKERSITNKISEIIVSYIMVSRYGKEKCLDFYINTVPVGANIYGFKAAAENYYHKKLDQLNIQQLVTIASFIPNHNRQRAFYNITKGLLISELPAGQKQHALSAMNKINLALGHLRKLKEISTEEYDRWYLTDEESVRKIGLRKFNSPLYGQEEWTSWNVIHEVCSRDYYLNGAKISGPSLLLDVEGDVIVETSVDLALIAKIKEIIDRFLASPKYQKILRKRNRKLWKKDLARYIDNGWSPPFTNFDSYMEFLKTNLNVGVIMVNPAGEIVAYVGGKEFLSNTDVDDDAGIIIDLMNNKATITPSSTMKPVIAYYDMVHNGSTLQTKYADKPIEFNYSQSAGHNVWLPRNWYYYNKKGTGANRYLGREYSLLNAQVQSVNTIFARLYNDRQVRTNMLIGFDKIDLKYNSEDAKYWPFGIGSSNLPVQQWLGVYNAFLDGKYRQPAFVTRITVNGDEIYNRQKELNKKTIPLFDSTRERNNEMLALYEVCNRGTAASMKHTFKHFKNLVSGKTGTAPQGKSALFISHFNPYRDRESHKEKTLTMMVNVTTNSGGYKSVGTSSQGPTQIAGAIYNYIFNKELHQMMDKKISQAKKDNAHFGNNHIYWANTNNYMDELLNGSYGDIPIYKNIIGVDSYEEALEQLLNANNKIYSGKNDLFQQLVGYYCRQEKIVKMK